MISLLMSCILLVGLPIEESASTYESLHEQWKVEMTAWKAELKAARKEGRERRKEVEDLVPTREYWPRFEALANEGEGRALLWMALEVEDLDLSRKEIRARKKDLVDRVLDEYVEKEWIEKLLPELSKLKKVLGEGGIRSALGRVYERNSHSSVRADAGVRLARRLDGRKNTPEEKAEALALYRLIARDFPDTDAGRYADDVVFLTDVLGPGRVAPDFTSEDVDGNEFKLSDYRGKVVVLDFWGFW